MLNQERLAFICGIDKGDVSRAVASLKEQGVLRTRSGVDGWILFEPRPDAKEWRGVRWRAADKEQRTKVLAELSWLSASDGLGDPQQTSRALRVEPTVEQELDGAMAEISRADALREAIGSEASVLNLGSSTFAPVAVIPPGETALGVDPVRGKPDWAALKARVRKGGGVDCLANEEPASDPAALAGQPTPTLGNQAALARQPTPTLGNQAALARQPTPALRAPSRDKPPSPSPILTSVYNPSPISPSVSGAEETEDGVDDAGRDGQTADGGAVWTRIAEVIGPRQAKEWRRWWNRELAPPRPAHRGPRSPWTN